MAGSSTDGASEPIAGSGALKLEAMVRVVRFNFGVHQGMLQSGAWKRSHEKKFATLMDVFTEDYGADIAFGCEVGGHKQGFSYANVVDAASLSQTKNAYSIQNYIRVLNTKALGWQLLREPQVTCRLKQAC